MAHRDNIAEVVRGRFANTRDVGGHQGYTWEKTRKPDANSKSEKTGW